MKSISSISDMTACLGVIAALGTRLLVCTCDSYTVSRNHTYRRAVDRQPLSEIEHVAVFREMLTVELVT